MTAIHHPDHTPNHDYRAVLHDLIEMGMDLARQIHRQATHDTPAESPTQPDTIAFDRIARAIRRTVLLAQSLGQPARPPQHDDQRRAILRRQVIRGVEDAIQRETPPEEAETLHAELLDRLDAPEFEDEIALRPLPDIIGDICRDLGLGGMPGTHPWKRRTPADLALLQARATTPAHKPLPPGGASILLRADRFRGK